MKKYLSRFLSNKIWLLEWSLNIDEEKKSNFFISPPKQRICIQNLTTRNIESIEQTGLFEPKV